MGEYKIKVSRGILNECAFSPYEGDEQVETISVDLYYQTSDEPVGYVTLVPRENKFYETHTFVDEEHRGKGFGVKLYAKAIKVGLKLLGEVRSSKKYSEDAWRVWTSIRLNKMYKIERINGIFRVKVW